MLKRKTLLNWEPSISEKNGVIMGQSTHFAAMLLVGPFILYSTTHGDKSLVFLSTLFTTHSSNREQSSSCWTHSLGVVKNQLWRMWHEQYFWKLKDILYSLLYLSRECHTQQKKQQTSVAWALCWKHASMVALIIDSSYFNPLLS